MTISQLAEMMNRYVNVRYNPSLGCYQVSIDGLETKDSLQSCILSTPWGSGQTVEDARESFARQLEGKYLVIDAYRPTRAVLRCPKDIKGVKDAKESV